MKEISIFNKKDFDFFHGAELCFGRDGLQSRQESSVMEKRS